MKRRWPRLIPALLAVAVFVVVAVLAVATRIFDNASERQARTMFAAAADAPAGVLTMVDLEGLPAPVQHWIIASGAVGKERARQVRLLQRGQMRTGLDAPWAEVQAKQYFTIQPPGFVWTVNTSMKGLPVAGRDHYLDGHGHMLITVGSLVKVVNAKDAAIDQGAMLRYLGEIIWFPSAAVEPYIRWEAIDADSARATMTWGDYTVTGVFRFDREGRNVGMTAQRYYYRPEGSTLEQWEVTSDEWKTIRGIRMPTRGDAHWKLKEGDLSYYRWEILDVEPNRPELYVPGEGPPFSGS